MLAEAEDFHGLLCLLEGMTVLEKGVWGGFFQKGGVPDAAFLRGADPGAFKTARALECFRCASKWLFRDAMTSRAVGREDGKRMFPNAEYSGNIMEECAKWRILARNYLRYQINMGFVEVVLPQPGTATTQENPLDTIRDELGACTRCPLHETRLHIVFGEGNPRARLMFIGEGPGADEDRQGRPFVGRAGQLLTRMIRAMGLDRSEVYITNTVKCRPPGNRAPNRKERDTCFPFLQAQITAVQPAAIVALGKMATSVLLGMDEPISRVRGRFYDRNGIPVMPTYHPSFLLREEPDRKHKAEAWADLKEVMALLDLPLPGSGD